ncbi:MAG TPA: adenylate/guanylate cyclase domain-containing protein, partial [Candidatus Cloacimonadota bacterium]|nr:adenylate/guanylate cyclase domain-containing protein [Candidatus Cloacimonadota bacterium]
MHDPLIPSYLARSLTQDRDAAAGELKLPFAHMEEAGIMNTDICSFTKITEMVSSQGHYGVEVITGILGKYFNAMISKISANGGCLLKYGGDSMFAVFPGSPSEAIPRMLNCRNQMYEAMDELNLAFDKDYGIRISFDGALKYGPVKLCVVGDPQYHLDYYLDGATVSELYRLGADAPDSEIVIAPEIREYENHPLLPCPEIEPEYPLQGTLFFPQTVQRKMQEIGFGAELRNTAVIFVHIDATDGSSLIAEEDYQALYLRLQRIVYDLDGTINKIDYTDKGYLVLITFGTPYHHSDDIERAFTCAYQIRAISSERLSLKIGLTYSNIYAGILGARERYEYGIIGNAVNIAARLMSRCEAGEISFSEDLLDVANSRFESVFVEETTVKGIAEALRIHKITGELPDSWSILAARYKDETWFGARGEAASVIKAIRDGESPYLSVVGVSGTGKSLLAYQILKKLREAGYRVEINILEEYRQNKQCDWFFGVLARKLMLSDILRDYRFLTEFCSRSGIQTDFNLLKMYFQSMSDSGAELSKEEIDLVYTALAEITVALFRDNRVIFIDDLQWLDSSSRCILT